MAARGGGVVGFVGSVGWTLSNIDVRSVVQFWNESFADCKKKIYSHPQRNAPHGVKMTFEIQL